MKAFALPLALTLALGAGSVSAQTSCAASDGGRLLASNCFQCHGTNGNSGAFDALAGAGLLMPAGVAGRGVRTIVADVANVIPAHRAPKVVRDAGLVPDGARYAPVNPLSFESTLRAGVHVTGDASDTTLPKAGHVGNQDAKICAAAIVNAFRSLPPDPAPTEASAPSTKNFAMMNTWFKVLMSDSFA